MILKMNQQMLCLIDRFCYVKSSYKQCVHFTMSLKVDHSSTDVAHTT